MTSTCEDFPCCGHERGDCDGSLYGTDAAIRARYLTHEDDLPDDDAAYCTPGHACHDCEGEPTGWECTSLPTRRSHLLTAHSTTALARKTPPAHDRTRAPAHPFRLAEQPFRGFRSTKKSR